MNAMAIADLGPAQLHKRAQQLGNTPLQPIYLMIEDIPRKIYLKLESKNPTGSVKDRTGYSLIQALEAQGRLHSKSIIIESTSGNLGAALSFFSRLKGYQFVAVVDPKTTDENLTKMQAFGAEIELVEQPDAAGGYLLSRLKRVQELCQHSDNYVWTNQYANPANPSIHYLSTGPEIYRQMHGKVDALFMAVSTGGTLAGVGRFFRKVSPTTSIIGVDAHGSVVFGTPPAPRRLTGIGSSRASSFITRDLYDTHILVKDEEAFALCRALRESTGIAVGGSSGAVLAACAKHLQAHPEIKDVVCLCADGGDNYVRTIFDDAWIQKQKLDVSKEQLAPVQDILCEVAHIQ